MDCEICKDTGMTGWEKPMGFPPVMVFVPQFCQCDAGKSLARMNAPDAKRTIISSMHDLLDTVTPLEKINERERGMSDWLRDNAPNVFEDQKHLDADTAERAYWHYGYMVALRDVLKLLDATTVN